MEEKGTLSEEAIRKSLETDARAGQILRESAEAVKRAEEGLIRSGKNFEAMGYDGDEAARRRDARAQTAEEREDLERERMEFGRAMREEMKQAVKDMKAQNNDVRPRKGPRKNIIRV